MTSLLVGATVRQWWNTPERKLSVERRELDELRCKVATEREKLADLQEQTREAETHLEFLRVEIRKAGHTLVRQQGERHLEAVIQELNEKPRHARKTVIALIAKVAGISWTEICGPRRTTELVRVRHAAMWLIREHCIPTSYPQIGLWLGGRDHTTVLHGCRKVEANKAHYADIISAVEKGLKAQ